ncbi:dihydrodipicolinate synthase family protein [Roseomonas sp. KE2513]|uniref:dihydrodipicolinate synthase family protein n=1 Tax=Roseomonas sp. KE2513 TaxID=2479202 RepID=UPI0018DF0893|nr:dihydrodipicolinate synthase family protein [Roseomonas sp. KE2513]MBI0534903.1 dihydrodipicolinate synthase family protein [Roseomonas sp. KE2513]
MPLHRADLPPETLRLLRQGAAIPAHPLALDAGRRFDARRQRALTRYYLDAGAGGLAVGVHTTQFEIREAGLYRPVLEAAMGSARAWTDRPLVMVAGLAGPTAQAVEEARTAVATGYHAGLLSLAAMKGAAPEAVLDHCRRIAEEIPLVGFYLQPAVGGVSLDADFWRAFCTIDNVVAVKVAPFNRYRTLDVVRGLVEAGAEDRVTLYTGNDDHIVLDLVTPFTVKRDGVPVTVRFRGGLLGHWSVWTRGAVQLLERLKAAVAAGPLPPEILTLDSAVTDCNAAFFDVTNNFHGCIAGCHEILRRQGLLEGTWCLNPAEGLSPGQAEAIDRVCRLYPEFSDDAFVAENLERWLS